MEEDQEHKYVCKFCGQSFHSGRSLGGHMRCHITMNSAEIEEKISDSIMGFEAGGQTGYGLRENPKKSWRFSDSNNGTSGQENHCRVCGKGFQSLRALSGHMRHHSQREREANCCKECGKVFGSLKALFGHMRCHSEMFKRDDQSEDETVGLIRRKRSRSRRNKVTVNSSLSNLNASSSSVTGIDQELEEVAMCLMMLSRDVGNWGGLNSGAASSDNNCLIFEDKSWNRNKPIAKNKSGSFVCIGDRTSKIKKKKKKLNSCNSDCGDVLFGKEGSGFDDMDSVILSNEEKKAELEVSVGGFFRGDELKNLKLENESRIDLPDTEMGKKFHDDELKIKLTEVKLGKDSTIETGLDRANSETMKSNSRKKARIDVYDSELGKKSCTKMKFTSDSKVSHDSSKKGKYKCRTCNKVFHSHQALGGHRASHKTSKSSSASKIESCEKGKLEDTDNSANEKIVEPTVTSYEFKKSKEHECPICFKVFGSGQALGGHTGTHFAGDTEIRVKETIMKHEHPDIDELFNIDLPATLEEEGANGRVEFEPWWVRSDHKPEPLVGLISN